MAEGKSVGLPNLFIPGAQKSATSTLVQLLKTHQDVFIGARKEPHFFSKDRKYSGGAALYRRYYAGFQGQRIVVDASQSYMPLSFVPQRIAETLGENIRFLFVLRNPVDRIVSAFTHFRTLPGGETERHLEDIIPRQLNDLTLEDLIQLEDQSVKVALRSGSIQSRNDTWSEYSFPFNYFYVSCYSKHITNYFKYFPKRNFLFMKFEEVTQNQVDVARKVADFLGVDYTGFELDTSIHANPSLVYRGALFSALLPALKKPLKQLFPRSILGRLKAAETKWAMTSAKRGFTNRTHYQLLRLFQAEIDTTEQLTELDLTSWKIDEKWSL